jgi:ubiquinone/menaquinone biosynthesis C-methylase UbiE
MKPNDFNNIGGTRFDLNRLPYPFYDELQFTIGYLVSEFCKKEIIKNPRILDLGIGSGYTSEAILMYHPEAHIIGIDRESIMLKHANIKLNYYISTENVKLVEDYIEHYLSKQETESIDCIVSCSTIHNNPPKTREKIMKESYRVLKNKGLVVIGDKIGPDGELFYAEEFAKLLINYKILLRFGEEKLFDYWMRHNIFDDQPALRMTENYVEGLMKNSNFINVERVWKENMTRVYVGYKE